MKQRMLAIIIAGIALFAAAYWWIVRPLTASEQTASAPLQTTGTSARGGAGRAVPGVVTDASAEKPKLDCTKPVGDVARVDDVSIPASRLCDVLTKTGGANAGALLDRMIDATLVERALASANETVTDAEIDAAARAVGGDPRAALLREQLRERVALRKLAARTARLEVSDAEVAAEIAAGAPGVDRGQGVRVEGWAARVAPAAGSAAREQAERAARAFAAAVPRVAPAEAAKQHGLTYLPPFVVSPSGVEADLEAAAAAVPQGRFSAPIQTKVGWLVIRVLGRVEGSKVDDRSFRERVRRALETRKLQAATTETLTRLRNAARIEILVDL